MRHFAHLLMTGRTRGYSGYVDHTPVWNHMYPCTRHHQKRTLTWKTLCNLFYVEVEHAIDSVLQGDRYLSVIKICVYV